jgi:hypothetical protein
MKKVVSLEVIKQYKDFYSKSENCILAKSVFFKCDKRISNTKTSKIS